MNFPGAPYPIIKTPRGFLYSQSGVKQIKSDLLILLMTNPGERVMLPTYGTPLRQLLFEPNDPALSQKVTEAISQAIRTWEPRVTIQAINVYPAPQSPSFNQPASNGDIGNLMGIQITFFDPENINEIQALTLEIPLAGG